MANKVIATFQDKDSKKIYKEGDLYEQESAERIAFLVDKGFLYASEEKPSDEPEFPKHAGGGWYELSNGEKVKGKDEAAIAEEELKKSGE